MNIRKSYLLLFLLSIFSRINAQDTLFIQMYGQFTVGIPLNQIDSISFTKPPDQAINEIMPVLYYAMGRSRWITGDRNDDFGYPMVCLSDDLNGPDITSITSTYDWFSPSCELSDRIYTNANPYLRWQFFYKHMELANKLLGSIYQKSGIASYNYARGQALAIRAFDLFNLVQRYQFTYKGHENDPAIPIELPNTNKQNNPRATVNSVFTQILTDLNESIELLQGFERPNNSYINQQVAYGIRARVNLVMNNWSDAVNDAEKAINGYTPYDSTEINKPGFNNANDHNWMWAIIITTQDISANLASWPSHLGSFSGYSYVSYNGTWRCINKLLYDKIPDTDVRKRWWLDENKYSTNLEGLTWYDDYYDRTYTGQQIPNAVIQEEKVAMKPYTNIKFGQRAGVGSQYNNGDWCLMRAEEMILIMAEALAKSGDLEAGRQVLMNFVTKYRNPAYSSTATTVKDFENEIWLQRRIELWGEGFSFVDAMRLKRNLVRFHPDKSTNVPEKYKFNIPTEDPWLLLRIPQKAMESNSALTEGLNNNGGKQPVSGDGAELKDGITD